MPDTDAPRARSLEGGDRLTEIRKRVAAATPGPWEVEKFNSGDRMESVFWSHYIFGPKISEYRRDQVVHDNDMLDADATFIAHSRSDVEYLLAEVERLNTVCEEHARVLGALYADT